MSLAKKLKKTLQSREKSMLKNVEIKFIEKKKKIINMLNSYVFRMECNHMSIIVKNFPENIAK